MTTERSEAYGRVISTLESVGAAKLHPAETERVRDAADTLLFASTLDEARHSIADVGLLAEKLLASDRWTEAAIDRLATDLLACGPSKIPAAA